MIGNELQKYSILPEFLDWALDELSQRNDSEIKARANIHDTQQRSLAETQKEFEELTKMRYKQLIDDNTFIREKVLLWGKIDRLKEVLEKGEVNSKQCLELTERSFKFAAYAQRAFLTGGLELKKEILLTLGNIPTIKDQTLHIEPEKWLVPIQNGYPGLEAEYLRLEPRNMLIIKEQTEAIASIRSRWRGQ